MLLPVHQVIHVSDTGIPAIGTETALRKNGTA
jgi:hypothetical protein